MTSKTGEPSLQPSTMSFAIASDLRAAILRGDLKPGQRIRQEEIAERHGASRIPVREALRILENNGLIRLVPNSGAWVADLNLDECVETYKIRERLEPLALSESIRNMTTETETNLTSLVYKIEQAQDVDEFLRLDREFHLLTYVHAAMPSLLHMIERFWNTTQHFRREYSGILGEEGQWIIHAEHRLLLAAIISRDYVEAENLLQAHIRKTRKRLTNESRRRMGVNQK